MIAFRTAPTPVSTSGASSLTLNTTAAGLPLALLVLGFEGVGAGSGPWVDPSGSGPGTGILGPGSGWLKILHQAPSATGCGLEVWVANWGASSTSIQANFTSSLAAIMALLFYDGAASGAGSGSTVRASASAQVTGNNPTAPDIYAYQNELVIRVAAQKVNSPGYTAPTGNTQQLDAARGNTHGNIELAVADAIAAVNGNAGTAAFSAATTSSPKGATASLAIRPVLLPNGAASGGINARFKAAA